MNNNEPPQQPLLNETEWVVSLMQRIDQCDLRFSADERAHLKRAVLAYHAGPMRSAVRLERQQVMVVVGRHVHSSHFLRLQAAVERDAQQRGME